MLNDLVLVWGEFVTPGPGGPPAVSVSTWSDALDQPWLRWDTRDANSIPAEVRTAKVALVNIFHTQDSRHIEQIKQVNPACYCIACPDACVDIILTRPDWSNMLRQMKMADAIGGRTNVDCQVYGEMLNKPTFYLPSPIGPADFFMPLREIEKEDYVLTLDHTIDVGNNTACNVAAVAALQRDMGCRVIYAAARDWTKDYAEYAGLKAEFIGHISFTIFAEMTARAQICVDMYTRHSYGRQQVLCAMVGTPIVGSSWCEDAPGVHVDPFNPRWVMERGHSLLSSAGYYKSVRQSQFSQVVNFGFDTCAARLRKVLEKIGVPA